MLRNLAMRWLVLVLSVSMLAAACGSTDGGSDTEAGSTDAPQSRREAPLDTETTAATGSTGADGQPTGSATEDGTSQTVAEDTPVPATSRRGGSIGECVGATSGPRGPSQSMQLLEIDGVSVELARYPRPDYEGDPWTHWGQGIALDDGRFVSGIGDHLGLDGNSYVYVYDPTTKELVQVADIGEVLGQQPGQWGQGKIHAQMVQTACDEVLFATYWGKRTGEGPAYEGGHILALDTSTYEVESKGIPAPGFGIPSLAAHDGLLYGEGADPSLPTGTDRGVFFVYDPVAQETIFSQINPSHDRFRSILIADDGTAFIATNAEGLLEYTPGGSLVESDTSLPSGWLRAVAPPTQDGTVYGVTRKPDTFFARSTDGTISTLGDARGYTTSLALTSDEKVLYIPDAHGDAWQHDASLYAFDPSTGADDVVVSLNGVAEERLGLTLGGTYSVTTSNDGSTVFIVFNAGTRDDPWGEIVLAIVHL